MSKEVFTELRKDIDGLHLLSKSITSFGNVRSKELEKCTESLILAKAWLGKVLGTLGQLTPYAKDGSRHSISDIEQTADTAKIGRVNEVDAITMGGNLMTADEWSVKNNIEKIDWSRQMIDRILNVVLPYSKRTDNTIAHVYEDYAHKYLCEARFWLGFELQRIKENK